MSKLTSNTHQAEPLPVIIALSALMNARDISARLVSQEPTLPDQTTQMQQSLKDALVNLPPQELIDVLSGSASILVGARPDMKDLVTAVQQRAEVRSVDPSLAQSTLELAKHLLDAAWLIPLIAAALRLLGDNKIKTDKLEIHTRSVLQDIAKVLGYSDVANAVHEGETNKSKQSDVQEHE